MAIPYYMNIVGADQPDRTYGMLDYPRNGSAWFCCQDPGAERNLVIWEFYTQSIYVKF